MKKIFEAHIITLGDSKVGKTSLIIRYMDNSFVETYLSTLGIDSRQKNIKLSSGEEITATIDYLKKQDDGKMLVVFRINTLTEDLILYRKISFNITWWSVSGIKIPNDAILEENGQKYVLKFK